jgi:glycerol-3-phosphate O-acyltransferase/dihydroxyacetone phosphate acyltransferase
VPRGPRTTSLPRDAVRALVRGAVSLYFRRIEVVGRAPGPETGGTLFVANHVNALIDPILVLTLADAVISPVAKSTLWSVPGLRALLDVAQAVPVVRRRDDPTKASGQNDAVFDRVGEWLARGGNILVFPEGTSHSQPHLLELRSGPARMLLRARATQPDAELAVQAVGLEFDDKSTFRSRCLVVWGPRRRLDDVLARPAEPGEPQGEPLEEARAVERLTAVVRDDLHELLVEGATWDERVLVARVAELFAHDEGDPSLEAWSALGRQVEAARDVLSTRAPGLMGELSQAVDAYYRALEGAGLTDAVVAGAHEAPRPRRVARRLLRTLFAPLAMVGFALYAPPYFAVRLFVSQRRARGQSEDDEVSTYKLGLGVVLFPTWALVLLGASLVSVPRLAPGSLALPLGAALVVLAAPFAALEWLDALPRLGRHLRARTSPGSLARLREQRLALMARLGRARDVAAPRDD